VSFLRLVRPGRLTGIGRVVHRIGDLRISRARYPMPRARWSPRRLRNRTSAESASWSRRV